MVKMLLGVRQRKQANRWRLGSTAAEPVPVRPLLSTVSYPGLGRSRWPRDESWHVPVNKQLSDESKAKGSKMPHCSPPFPPLLPSPHTPGAFSGSHPPPLPTQLRPAYKCLSGGGVLCIMNFLPGNFLWWKLWGNFLLSRLLPRPDNRNCLNPQPQLLKGGHGSSLSSQCWGNKKGRLCKDSGVSLGSVFW